MGMDVYGRKPKNEKGEYFRNNVWFWHPLWDYCQQMYPKITSKCVDGHTNSGDGLNASDAKRLANLIKKDLENGKAEKWKDDYCSYLDSLQKEPCNICSSTGVQKVKIKQDSSDVELEQERKCFSCDGEGVRDNWAKNYPFTIENLREWQEFLENCGGFNIY